MTASEPGPLIGAATADESAAIVEFWSRAAENSDRPDDSPKAVAALIDRDPEAVLVARSAAGEILGTVIVGWDGWRCHLYRLAVDPERRSEGIGRRLLETAEARGRSLGAVRMDAMILDDNLLAHHVWSALGYRRQREWSRWVKPLD